MNSYLGHIPNVRLLVVADLKIDNINVLYHLTMHEQLLSIIYYIIKKKMGYSLYNVRSTARHAKHLQLNISANALEIRAIQRTKCIV
jgi:hypothetical protein